MDGVGRLRRFETHEGGISVQQPRSQRAPLHGLRRWRFHAHLRHGRAHGLLRRLRTRRRLRPVGRQHGGDASHPLVSINRSQTKRAPRQSGGVVHLREQMLRTRRHPHGVRATKRSRHSQLHRQPHYSEWQRQRRLRQQAYQLPPGKRGYRLRTAPGTSLGEKRQEQQKGRRFPTDDHGRVCRVRTPLRSRFRIQNFRRSQGTVEGAGRTLCRPRHQGDVDLDHGVQSAHPGRLVQ